MTGTMNRSRFPFPALASAFVAALAAGAFALACPTTAGAQQRPAKADKPAESNSPFSGFGGNSKDPIKIDSDRLEVFDKDKKAIFSGNVIAVQGETTMRCSTLTVFYEQSGKDGGKDGAKGGKASKQSVPAGPNAESGVRRLECAGPVTVIAKDQIATANQATYDKQINKVILTGNAKLSQGPNVTTGERVVYDLTTSRATVETRPGERVKALLVPGSDTDKTPADKAAKAEKKRAQ